jgi:SAM-dependent methyltransferase
MQIAQNNTMNNILVKLIGYPATVLHGDAAVFDRWRWLKKYLLPGNLRTLDAGCGSGAFTMYEAKIGNQAVGISFDERNNKTAAERAKILGISNVSFIQGDLRKLDEMFEALEKFDQIICFETIEHILDDKKLIKDFSSLLKPGGKLLLTTPYKYSNPLYGDDKDKLSTYEEGGHVRWGYTHGEMGDLLKKFDFEIEATEYITGYISQKLINLQRVISEINPKLAWLIVFPLRIFQFLDPLFNKIINYPHLSIGIIAAKR